MLPFWLSNIWILRALKFMKNRKKKLWSLWRNLICSNGFCPSNFFEDGKFSFFACSKVEKNLMFVEKRLLIGKQRQKFRVAFFRSNNRSVYRNFLLKEFMWNNFIRQLLRGRWVWTYSNELFRHGVFVGGMFFWIMSNDFHPFHWNFEANIEYYNTFLATFWIF